MPKRKVEEVGHSSDDEPPASAPLAVTRPRTAKSKRTLRNEAIARAKLAMQKDKAKVDASKQRKRSSISTNAAAAAVAAVVNASGKDDEKNVVKEEIKPKKTSPSTVATPAKRRRVQPEGAPSPEIAEAKTSALQAVPKSGARVSRKQQIEDAKRRAQEWGNKERSKKVPTTVVRATSKPAVKKEVTTIKVFKSSPAQLDEKPILDESMDEDDDEDIGDNDDNKPKVQVEVETQMEGQESAASTPQSRREETSPAPSTTPRTATHRTATPGSKRKSAPVQRNAATPTQAAVPSAAGPVYTSPQFASPMQYQPVPPGAWMMSQNGILVPAQHVASTFSVMQNAGGFAPQQQQQPQQPAFTHQVQNSQQQFAQQQQITNATRPHSLRGGFIQPPPVSSPNDSDDMSAAMPMPGLARTASSALRQSALRNVSTKSTSALIDDDDDDDDDDFMPPPPAMALEKQISQQVMANCAAALKGQPLPFTAAPPLAFSSRPSDAQADEADAFDDEPIVVDNDAEHHTASGAEGYNEIPAQPTIFSRFPILVAVFVVAATVFMASSSLFDKNIQANILSDSDNIPCFLDSYQNEEEDYVSPCAEDEAVACPDGGVCSSGSLIGCISANLEVADIPITCTPTQQTNTTIDVIRNVLESWTIQDQCGSSPSETLPVFPYVDLQTAKPEALAEWTLEKGLLDEEYVIEYFDDGVYVGLPEDHDIVYPFGCRLNRAIKEVLALAGSSMFSAFIACIKFSFSGLMAYPLSSLIGLIVVIFFRQRQKRMQHRNMVMKDVANGRQMTYERLMEDFSQSHVVLHIRDEIAMALFPHSKKSRVYLHREVWPRIVADIQCDNRVRKSSKIMEGKQRDVWQWIAATSAKKKTVRLEG